MIISDIGYVVLRIENIMVSVSRKIQNYLGRCYFCQKNGEGLVCDDCREYLYLSEDKCSRCCKPLSLEYEHIFCKSCISTPPPFVRAYIPFGYQDPIKQLLTKFKFEQRYYLGSILSTLLITHLKNTLTDSVDALIPVPLHINKMRQRGFNQAQYLADIVSREFNIPLFNGVERIKNTPAQFKLLKGERHWNLKNAFRLTQNIPYQNVAIVDDIVSTGATISEITKLFNDSCVENVFVIALCRA